MAKSNIDKPKHGELESLIGGTFFGFCLTLFAKTFIEHNLQLHIALRLPKTMVSIPLSLLKMYSFSTINPFSDNRIYDTIGGLLAIFVSILLDEVDFENRIAKYPKDINKFTIQNGNIYWMGKKINNEEFNLIKYCLRKKSIKPVVEHIG